MQGEENPGSLLRPEVFYDRRLNLAVQHFRDRLIHVHIHFREYDADDCTFFIPTDQIGLSLGSQNNIHRLPDDSGASPAFQVCIEQHQDKGPAGTLGALALKHEHRFEDIPRYRSLNMCRGEVAGRIIGRGIF